MGDERTLTHTPRALQVCPKCGGALRVRHGSRGAFVGCSTWPACTYTKSTAAPAPTPTAVASPPVVDVAIATSTPPKTELPIGTASVAIADLRAAAGYLGKAVELIKKHHAELDALVDQRDEISF